MVRFLDRFFVGIDGIGVARAMGCGKGLLEFHFDAAPEGFEALQHCRLKDLLMIRGGNITECKENSVAGVVVLGIKIPQRLVG